jgi:hypothetical protein
LASENPDEKKLGWGPFYFIPPPPPRLSVSKYRPDSLNSLKKRRPYGFTEAFLYTQQKGDLCMKQFCVFTAVFLLAGIFPVHAQDLLVLKDGNMIEAKVTEISPTEIRYKRYNNLDGPTIVVPSANVLSIRYENGTTEIINHAGPGSPRAGMPQNTAIDPNRVIFGINANAGGALGYILGGAAGTGVTIELGKGRFNSEISLMFPIGGFGFLAAFNGFWPSRIGGFYLGGGVGFSFYSAWDYYYDEATMATSLPLGLNIGYKFVTPSGLYFRTGVFAGFDFGWLFSWGMPVYIKPDLAVGWTMK